MYWKKKHSLKYNHQMKGDFLISLLPQPDKIETLKDLSRKSASWLRMAFRCHCYRCLGLSAGQVVTQPTAMLSASALPGGSLFSRGLPPTGG